MALGASPWNTTRAETFSNLNSAAIAAATLTHSTAGTSWNWPRLTTIPIDNARMVMTPMHRMIQTLLLTGRRIPQSRIKNGENEKCGDPGMPLLVLALEGLGRD